MEKYCPICEVQHEIKVIESGIDNGVEWIAYRCDITGKEFEVLKSYAGKMLPNLKPGRQIFLLSEQSPSVIEPISGKSAFDLDALTTFTNHIVPFQAQENKERYLSQFVEAISQNLKIFFVAIYLVDKEENWLVFQAGSEEEISRFLHRYEPKMRIMDHNDYLGQAGAAVYTGEIRLVHWGVDKIIGYKIVNGRIHEKIVKGYSTLFLSPSYNCEAQLYFPLQDSERKIGVLEFTFDTLPWISHIEILKVQQLANQLAMMLSEGKNV